MKAFIEEKGREVETLRMMLFCGLLLALAAPASADWQFTKWGMTPEQLMKKAPVSVTKVPAEERSQHEGLTTEGGMIPLLQSDWNSGSFRFHVCYRFDAGKHLSAIDLEILDDSQATDVANALTGKYGKPESESGPGYMLASRNWTTQDETIEFLGPHFFRVTPRDSTAEWCTSHERTPPAAAFSGAIKRIWTPQPS